MDNEINTQTTAEAEDPVGGAAIDEDVMLPDDYEEGKPYSFEEATDTEEKTAEDPTELPDDGNQPAGDAPDGQGAQEAPEADQPGTGEDPAADPAAAAPAQAAAQTSNTIKFTDTFQGVSREVELSMDQLPALYRKAQTADFVTRRTTEHEGKARALGYKGVDDMLTRVRTAMIEGEVAALMDENVHETLARDVVNRKYPEYVAPQQQRPAMPAAPTQPARNLVGELSELFGSYPALRGQKIPQEVTDAARGGKRLLNAYRDYLEQQRSEETARLRKENETLKQNAAAAARAPVKSVTAGGATDLKSEDAFLTGFNRF